MHVNYLEKPKAWQPVLKRWMYKMVEGTQGSLERHWWRKWCHSVPRSKSLWERREHWPHKQAARLMCAKTTQTTGGVHHGWVCVHKTICTSTRVHTHTKKGQVMTHGLCTVSSGFLLGGILSLKVRHSNYINSSLIQSFILLSFKTLHLVVRHELVKKEDRRTWTLFVCFRFLSDHRKQTYKIDKSSDTTVSFLLLWETPPTLLQTSTITFQTDEPHRKETQAFYIQVCTLHWNTSRGPRVPPQTTCYRLNRRLFLSKNDTYENIKSSEWQKEH